MAAPPLGRPLPRSVRLGPTAARPRAGNAAASSRTRTESAATPTTRLRRDTSTPRWFVTLLRWLHACNSQEKVYQHELLRRVSSGHVRAAGSYVVPDRLMAR